MALPDVTYEVVFRPWDGFPEEEVYQYVNREDAEAHYSLFFSADSGELYSSVILQEYDWRTRMETVLKRMDFTRPADD